MLWLKALWTGLPLPWKIGAVAIAILGIFLLYRWRLNAAYNDGFKKGKDAEIESVAKQVEEKVKEERAAIAVEWQSLNERSSQLEADKKKLAADKLSVRNEQTQARATLDAATEAYKLLASAVPVNELYDAIRAVSNELAPNRK